MTDERTEREVRRGVAEKILRRVGYAPEHRIRELSKALARAEQRITTLERDLEAARKDVLTAKEHARVAAERSAAHGAELEKRWQDRLAKGAQKTEREIARIREHDAARSSRIDDVRERMTRAEKPTRQAEEHLMAIEVKLDILEGAVNVLDQRLRTVRQP